MIKVLILLFVLCQTHGRNMMKCFPESSEVYEKDYKTESI